LAPLNRGGLNSTHIHGTRASGGAVHSIKSGHPASNHKVEPKRVSPDDIKYKLAEMAKLSEQDTRTEAQRWLGDPPPWRSALAMKRQEKPA
jgi:hypothetical protein